MTDNERDVERRITTLESNVNNLVEELRDFKTEMRQQNQMRAEELRDLQKRQDAMQAKYEADMRTAQAKHDADMKASDEKIAATTKEFTQQLHSNFVQTMIGVGAIMAAVGGLIIAAVK